MWRPDSYFRSPSGIAGRPRPRIARVERMKIRIRLPLLEQQLDLPSQPVELPHLFRTDSAPRQIRHEQRMTLLIRTPSRQQPQLQRLFGLTDALARITKYPSALSSLLFASSPTVILIVAVSYARIDTLIITSLNGWNSEQRDRESYADEPNLDVVEH